MSSYIHPQEIFLLERYISVEYFAELRDRWEAMVLHVEMCLGNFMKDLPPQYRSHPLSEQPDVVWGQRILPNFRDTLQSLNEGLILLSHNDFSGLHYAWAPRGDYKGQMDYSTEWMSKEDEDIYKELLEDAVVYARNICITEGGDWAPLSLLNYPETRGPLNPPLQWPIYRINKNVIVKSGEKVEQSGVYLPNLENSCAQFLSTRYDAAPPAKIIVEIKEIVDSATEEKWDEEIIVHERACIWALVERVADTGNSSDFGSLRISEKRRLASGEVCSEAGYYFSPARPGSRRYFRSGDMLPDLDSQYGRTIWQWDDHQAG